MLLSRCVTHKEDAEEASREASDAEGAAVQRQAAAMASAEDDATQRAFEADTAVSSTAMPWTAAEGGGSPPPDGKLYAVATWARGGARSFLPFAMHTSRVNAQLAAAGPELLGFSLCPSYVPPLGWQAETLTVWRNRAAAAAFFGSGAHAAAMQALRGAVSVRARRVWLPAADLPSHGASVVSLWTAIKRSAYCTV